MYSILTIPGPDLRSANHATAQYQVGALYTEIGVPAGKSSLFKYVQFKTAAVVGTLMTKVTDINSVTKAVTLGALNNPAGLALTTVTIDYYSFVKIRGPITATDKVITDGGVAALDLLVIDAAGSNQADTFVSGTNSGVSIGMAFAADSGTWLVNGFLDIAIY